MWCDDFDIDLYRAVPGAREVLAPVADVVLYTHGHVTDGKLNHPSCWNHNLGTVAFFGFNDPAKPPEFYVGNAPVVRCTFEEAVRDLWVHALVMIVEGVVVWDSSQAVQRRFDLLMGHMRGWRQLGAREVERAQLDVMESIGYAVNGLHLLRAAASPATPSA